MSQQERGDPKYWTAEQANAELPRVTEIVHRIRDATAHMRARAAIIAEKAPTNGHTGASTAPDELRRALAELAEDGILVRDPDQGLVDFPALAPSGKTYWLCWVVGEPAVDWWHWPEDGFAGRTPLGEPPT